ncbi:PD-(D/E)XK nuclease-like domain-containing protein [Mesorhizobium sp. RP14(2022)]|uniref:PD-(D/E)XK nuclease-like domain-containing protein n=1 Tax=Mesorhizobium liriopis TaxID=2953882 RepID=A0ABT1C7R7_9HYPH|nr:PD-(D/E)XK nuclease-like domain-containing protein [Mesorhizobium liriopis]MCO6050884.1 PD-(D/E)XK nuclease-like domain-containing protein [Mesorhizobium liriopis]
MNAHTDVSNLPEPIAALIPDGIHFGLEDTAYHADPALGSTGLKDLIDNAPDFWWSSWMNPARELEKETPARIFGRAVHKCVLEGRSLFEQHYGPCEHHGNVKAGIAERVALEAEGKIALKRDDFNRILAASAFIKANSHLRAAFEGGYPEVSVFWTQDGVRFKARFDYLKMRAIADLKSIRNPLNKSFVQACRERIAGLDYIVSAAHYMAARSQMARLVKAGAIYGAPDDPNSRSWLIQAAGIREFAFVFVFWQAEGAPISHGFKISPGNPLLASAEIAIGKAVHNYRTFMADFGTDTAWVPSTPLEELDETDMPIWWQVKQTTGK